MDNFITLLETFILTFYRNDFLCTSPDFSEGYPPLYVKH
jgi:hypothetical protein